MVIRFPRVKFMLGKDDAIKRATESNHFRLVDEYRKMELKFSPRSSVSARCSG
jgi:hypothetical protein